MGSENRYNFEGIFNEFRCKINFEKNVFATKVRTKCLIEPPRALIDIRVTNYTHIHTERNSVHFNVWDYF